MFVQRSNWAAVSSQFSEEGCGRRRVSGGKRSSSLQVPKRLERIIDSAFSQHVPTPACARARRLLVPPISGANHSKWGPRLRPRLGADRPRKCEARECARNVSSWCTEGLACACICFELLFLRLKNFWVLACRFHAVRLLKASFMKKWETSQYFIVYLLHQITL